MGCALLALSEKSNTQGLSDMGANPEWLPGYASARDESALACLEKDWCVSLRGLEGAGADVAEALRKKKIKVAVVLGEDPAGHEGFPREFVEGLCAADFLVVGDSFLTATARLANVVLPLSSTAETSGTVTNAERRVQSLQRAVPAPAGLETWQLLTRLAAHMGYRFKMKYASVAEVQEEIRRVFPAYAGVVVDDEGADGTWSARNMGLPRVPFDYACFRDPSRLETLRPVPTLGLDAMEARFSGWFDAQMERARKAEAAEVA